MPGLREPDVRTTRSTRARAARHVQWAGATLRLAPRPARREHPGEPRGATASVATRATRSPGACARARPARGARTGRGQGGRGAARTAGPLDAGRRDLRPRPRGPAALAREVWGVFQKHAGRRGHRPAAHRGARRARFRGRSRPRRTRGGGSRPKPRAPPPRSTADASWARCARPRSRGGADRGAPRAGRSRRSLGAGRACAWARAPARRSPSWRRCRPRLRAARDPPQEPAPRGLRARRRGRPGREPRLRDRRPAPGDQTLSTPDGRPRPPAEHAAARLRRALLAQVGRRVAHHATRCSATWARRSRWCWC